MRIDRRQSSDRAQASLTRSLRPLLLACALGMTSCSSSDPAPEATNGPLLVVKGEQGSVVAEVRTSPSQPPARGLTTVELRVLDASSSQPVDGLTVTVVPWMPSHAHGASVEPSVTALGSGRYRVSDVALFMPGRWELRTTVAGPKTDTLTPAFDVP
jgi:hypothetical protein